MKSDLSGNGIELRGIEDADLPELGALLNDRETTAALAKYLGRDQWTDAQVRERFEGYQKAQREGTGLWYTVRRKNTSPILGFCGFKNIRTDAKEGEFGLMIHRSEWGRGIAQACHRVCLNYGFKTLGFVRVTFVTDYQNVRMRAFFDKWGIRQIAETPEGIVTYGLSAEQWEQITL